MADEARQAPGGSEGTGDDAVSRIVDRFADLLQTAADWLRQEAESTVRLKIVPPLQQLGLTVASAAAAAALLVVGLLFVAVWLIMLLGSAIGYSWAFLVAGLLLLVGSGVFLAIKVRSMQ